MRPLLLLALLGGCKADPTGDRSPLYDVEESASFHVPALEHPVIVVRTEADVPHVYATNRLDLARISGFVQARDRFFTIDMARRLSLGEVSALLGDVALGNDLDARGSGMTQVADNILANLTDEQAALFDAFAEGIDAYIDAVEAGELDPPEEYEIVAPFLGVEAPIDLMARFDRRDIAAIGATLTYELGYETGDVGRARTAQQLPDLYEGAALSDLRKAGVYADIWERVEPVWPTSSSEGWGVEGEQPPPPLRARREGKRVPDPLLERLSDRLTRLEERLGHVDEAGWGSNAWAVMGSHATDGQALLAGDGHLPLTVAPLFYQIGLDTRELGGGSTHQLGLVIPGMPILAVGTNGHVAWSQTQLMGDITDWYREEVRLGDDGLPAETLFEGEWMPLERHEERFAIADVPLLGSVGRDETYLRFTTFDGRWLADVEGTDADAETEGAIPMGSQFVVPGDTDGDGVITAVSFDYTALDDGNILLAVDRLGHARDVREYREATRGLVAYSQNLVAADSAGSIYYSGYQAVPCRTYLEREADGAWAADSDPSRLLDGTRYGGFTIPVKDGIVDESDASDPYRCVVPFDEYPAALDPVRGYVLTANNDIGKISTDGSMTNDPWYVGGPWVEGYRADSIDRLLEEAVGAGEADEERMAVIQGDVASRLGQQFGPVLLDAIEAARAVEDPLEGSSEERLQAWYLSEADAIEEVHQRIEAWLEADAPALSGVETFYHQPDADELDHAVATTIFNTWMGRWVQDTLEDEGLPGVWQPSGATGRLRTLKLMLEGRGEDDPMGMASWNPETGESAFFDVLGTDVVEESDEVALMALVEALDMLRAASDDDGRGGFGTEDMDQWLWGLRHWVHFDSILEELVGSDSTFSFITSQFAITPKRIPLADGLDSSDPRKNLPGFPRPGDNFAVDAANAGLSGRDFDYGSGPVFRMVIAIGPDGVSGRNVLPGGQSGDPDSPFFDDQAQLWLGNETIPMRFSVEEVIEGAVGRESYWP